MGLSDRLRRPRIALITANFTNGLFCLSQVSLIAA